MFSLRIKPVFIGIDVACGKNRRLPICIVEKAEGRISPIEIPRDVLNRIPRGTGNLEVMNENPFAGLALAAAKAISEIGKEKGWSVRRIAIDAPVIAPDARGRKSEKMLMNAGLPAFQTPKKSDWQGIIERCRAHCRDGGAVVNLPNANRLWMLYGFELFRALLDHVCRDVIEVYPFAIVRALLPFCEHKSTEQGYRDQLSAIARRTGWIPEDLEIELRPVPGSRHDKLDAFMAAWVATLPKDKRCAYGHANDRGDAIWVPRTVQALHATKH